jgi:tetratricopeptide (TPR) repeat protein
MTLDPNDPRLRAAVDADNRGDINQEAALLEVLLAEYPDELNLLQRLGAIEARRGKVDAAIAYLERARKIEPENIRILIMLGLLYKQTGKRDEAKLCFENLLALDPKMVEALANLADIHQASGDVDAARACCEKALAIKPDLVNLLAKLALLHERGNRLEEAQAVAQRALAIAPGHVQANFTLAIVELRIGKAQQAIEQLERLLNLPRITALDASTAQYLIGQARNKMGEYDKAFTAYEVANTKLHGFHQASVAKTSSVLMPAFLHRLHAFLAAEDLSAWTKPKQLEEPAPVFFLGFPRSGTTLLDQILKAHSAVVSLEERENLIDIRNEVLLPDGALEKMPLMTGDEINRHRKSYWSRVLKELKIDNAAGVIIDKMPLNTTLLGLIYRLFPEAKIIFALRDPRDVVLSCYQQRFGINAAMFQFLKLESAAAYYDLVMSLGEVCRARMPLNLHVVRYEDVVTNMQKTVSDVLAFLELEWEDAMLDYREQARERWITTPSAEQVIEPIYASSMGKWRNYQRHMEPILPVLEPWVKKHGYDAS